MAVGTWQPASEPEAISSAALEAALLYTDAESFPKSAPDDVASLQTHMQATADCWQPLLSEASTESLENWVRFFTLAEQHWTDWFGGDKNPAIWAWRELKARGALPNKPLLQWVKSHTDNRYLPYGNLMG